MTIGKLVRLSPETMKKLEQCRNGFETPNDCISRILDLASPEKQNKDDETKFQPHYDKYGNYWTYKKDEKIWSVKIDPKKWRIVE